MKRTAALVALLAAAQTVRRVNTFELMLDDGRAELEFLSTASFRFKRVDAFERWRSPLEYDSVKVECSGEADAFRCRTDHIQVVVAKRGGGFSVSPVNGPALMTATIQGREFTSPMQAGERFYGLGVRDSAKLDLRGASGTATRHLLISSAGYGEYRDEPSSYDFREPARRMRSAGSCFFYFGPTPKEILELHAAVVPPEGQSAWLVRTSAEPRSWFDLRDNIYRLQHATLSGGPDAPFVLAGYTGAARARAEQVAALLPLVHAPGANPPAFRDRLLPYLLTYAWEARDRGIPIVRPLAIQFPEDAVAAERSGEFMVGDELLVAPVLDESGAVKVYLPRGVWTDLRTGEVHPGRQEIVLQAPPGATPVFTHNGMIVPLAGRPLEMHYFPRLPAEFFLYEPQQDYISQFHAAPTTDLLRLESEAILDREFDWVLHQVERVTEVTEGDRKYTRVSGAEQLKPGAWLLDGATLRIRVAAKAAGDEIIHVAF